MSGGSECFVDDENDSGVVDVADVEEDEEEVMVDDDEEVSVKVADIVERCSDVLRCCRCGCSVVVRSVAFGVDSGWLSKVDSKRVGEFRFDVCAMGCVSVSICICKDC